MASCRFHVIFGIICTLFNAANSAPELYYPLQLSASIVITSHLIDPENDYPPRTRSLQIYYDYINKRARADIAAGYEAEKVYLRLYGDKKEYMIRAPPISDCKRSYLGDSMPLPEIRGAEFVGTVEVRGILCRHYIFTEYDHVSHVYMSDSEPSFPVQLIYSHVADGTEEQLLTYDYSNVIVGPPEAELFDLPSNFTHKSCDRVNGGFPYLHVFHYFVKF